jgi:cytochrome P450
MLSDPRDIRALFTASPDVFLGGRGNRSMDPLLGESSTLTLDGDAHRAHRRLAGPPLRAARLDVHAEVVRDMVDRTMSRWTVGAGFRAAEPMDEITLGVIFRAVFGVTRADRLARLHGATSRMRGKVTASLALLRPFRVDLGPLSPWGRFVRARREFEAVIKEEADDVRGGKAPGRTDALAQMVMRSIEAGAPLGDEELCSEMLTLLMAGHESTTATLAWALQWILGSPSVLARVKDEIRSTKPAADLPYLGAVVAETLRMTPPFLLSIRHVAKDAQLGDMVLPAGADVTPCIHLVHRDPAIYPEPDAFRPERFLGARPSPFEYLPFGGGGRMCVGASFSTFLVKNVLARVLQRADLELLGERRQRPTLAGIALFPAGGTPVRLRAVEGGQ